MAERPEDTPDLEEHPEREPTNLDEGESLESGEGPLDDVASKSQPHGVPTDR
ncbi:MAG TPA: hypothetical protein VE088_04430 [Gaiellaceae bacterium]|jgi:hypothetical protein|nr:hypothetical protein [Gaiellaceae bacterium]